VRRGKIGAKIGFWIGYFCWVLSEKGVPVAQIGWFSAVSGGFSALSGRDLSAWVGALPIRARVLIDWASWRFFLTRFGRTRLFI
jgi:hypothetical protein